MKRSVNVHRARDNISQRKRPRRQGMPSLSVVQNLDVEAGEVKSVNRDLYRTLRRKGHQNVKVFRFGESPLNIANRAAFRNTCVRYGQPPDPKTMKKLFEKLCEGLQGVVDNAPNDMNVPIGELVSASSSHPKAEGRSISAIAIQPTGIKTARSGLSLVEHVGKSEQFGVVVDANKVCVDGISESMKADEYPSALTGDVNIPLLGTGPRDPDKTLLAIGPYVMECLPETVMLGSIDVAECDGAGGTYYEELRAA